MKCEYGCNNAAMVQLKNNKWCCSKSANSCPENRRKNSESLKACGRDYSNFYSSLPEETKGKMKWNKNKVFVKFEMGVRTTGSHKKALIKDRGHKCECCNRKTWLGKKIALELEHIDGNKSNSDKINLLLLCPNCHSQTPTWRRRKNQSNSTKFTDEQMLEAIKSSSSMSDTLKKLGLAWGSYITILKCMKRNGINIDTWN